MLEGRGGVQTAMDLGRGSGKSGSEDVGPDSGALFSRRVILSGRHLQPVSFM